MTEQAFAIEQALRSALPEALGQQASRITDIIVQALAQGASSPISVNPSVNKEEVTDALNQLAGKKLISSEAVISIGDGNSIGDITISSIAGRDNITINIHIDIPKDNRYIGGVILCQTTCTVFVDIMRILYVTSYKAAHEVNGARFSEFILVARQHLTELNNHVSRVVSLFDANIHSSVTEIEQRFAWMLTRFQVKSSGIDANTELFRVARELAITIEHLSLQIAAEYFSKQQVIFQKLKTKQLDNAIKYASAFRGEERLYLRLRLQTLLLQGQSNKSVIYTIVDDIDQNFAVQYYLIDLFLLQEAHG